MMKVDLTLAVNYLPACGCLARLFCYLLTVSGIHPAQEIGGFTVLAAMLYLDYVCTPKSIFDSSAILLAVFFSQVHGAVRVSMTSQGHPVGMAMIHVIWGAACILLVVEPPAVRRMLERKRMYERFLPTVWLLASVTTSAFFHSDRESLGVLSWRALGFTLLCFGWIYVVGIEDSTQGIEQLRHNSHPFIHRMAPMLFSPVPCTILFFPLAVAGLAFQFLRRYKPSYIPQCQALESYARVPTAPPAEPLECITEEPPEEPAEDLEELLRMARQRTGREPAPI